LSIVELINGYGRVDSLKPDQFRTKLLSMARLG